MRAEGARPGVQAIPRAPLDVEGPARHRERRRARAGDREAIGLDEGARADGEAGRWQVGRADRRSEGRPHDLHGARLRCRRLGLEAGDEEGAPALM